MKLLTTKKAIKSSFKTVLSINYCSAQFLLYYSTPFAYSAGTYGWACDYYDINGICVSTGYSPVGNKVNYDILKSLECRAEKIVNNYSLTYEQQKNEVYILLSELITSCL